MTIIERIHSTAEAEIHGRGYGSETMTLGWEDRTRVHGRQRTDGGVDFGVQLPRGTVLREGDCLLLDAERLVVSIVESPEPVLVIQPANGAEWALCAYHIGNRHQPLMVTERAILCPDAPSLEALLQQHRIAFTRATLPFTPVAGAAAHAH